MVNIFTFLESYNSVTLAILIVVILTLEVFLFSFPKEIVMVYGGFAFGTVGGGLLNFLGLVGAVWLGFEGGYAGRISFDREQKVVLKFQNWLENRGILALGLLRFFPLTPNDVLSITCGFFKLKRIPYLIISVIAAIPYAFLWSYLGATQIDELLTYMGTTYDPVSSGITFLIFLGILYIVFRYFSKANKQ